MCYDINKMIRRITNCFFLMLFFNSVLLYALFLRHEPAKLCIVVTLSFAVYLYFNVNPYGRGKRRGRVRLNVLMGGRECILMAMTCSLLEIALYIALIASGIADERLGILAVNAAVFCALVSVLVINGVVRIFITSRQAGFAVKLQLVLFWWVPVLNLVLLKKICGSAVREYVYMIRKADINEARKAEEICRTKYPLLLVHGVFWRDWKNFNYWGRIPGELEANGATCFYGNHKSSSSVAESGAELADCIRDIVSETGCEKLNLIAHSKGGLDCRYAISCRGMGKYVASLTTVSTPHYGCNSIRKIVERIPENAMRYINEKYETLYTILGDDSSDFISGLEGITDTECAALNELAPDDPQVYYQSVGSKMRSPGSALFPLSLGYSIIKPAEGDNDGLVATDSMIWGDFLGIVAPVGKQGVSHGDMIDLTRKDIDGFDVCEFYVDLVSRLKKRGL